MIFEGVLSPVLLEPQYGGTTLGTSHEWLRRYPLSDGGGPPPVLRAIAPIGLRKVATRQSQPVVLPGPTEVGRDVLAHPPGRRGRQMGLDISPPYAEFRLDHGQRKPPDPEPVEGVLRDRVICVGRDAVADQPVTCRSGAGMGRIHPAVCQPDSDRETGAVNLLPRWDGAATDAPRDASGADTLHTQGDEAQVAKGDRLRVREKSATPRHRVGEIDLEALQRQHPSVTKAKSRADCRQDSPSRFHHNADPRTREGSIRVRLARSLSRTSRGGLVLGPRPGPEPGISPGQRA